MISGCRTISSSPNTYHPAPIHPPPPTRNQYSLSSVYDFLPEVFVNSLKQLESLTPLLFLGTDDMKAPDLSHYSRPRSGFRPLSADFPTWPSKSMYEDPIHAGERITIPGYRYIPVSRETYGISPRPIYAHHYSSPRFGSGH